jgi:predicted methyltransferase
MNKRISLTTFVHDILNNELNKGDCVIDATLGNGHDTLFLAQQVGNTGHIFGFDVQQQAITATQLKLQSEKLDNFSLFHACHSEMDRHVPQQKHGIIKAILFNLGYLPGSDKKIITQANTTQVALNQSINLLGNKGIIVITAYPGHSGGETETEQVKLWCEQLNPLEFTTEQINSSEKKTAPRLFIVRSTSFA